MSERRPVAKRPPVGHDHRLLLKRERKELGLQYWLLNTELQTLVDQLRLLAGPDQNKASFGRDADDPKSG